MYNESFRTCLHVCPKSSSPDEVGFYGGIKTLICYSCPGNCSNCNVDIIRNAYPILDCGNDNFCSDGIICTSCLTGNILIAGKCVQSETCFEDSYAYAYNNSCNCLTGHSDSHSTSCGILCDIECKTCEGTSKQNCLSCDEGYQLINSACVGENVA